MILMPRNPEHNQAQTAGKGCADKTARPSAALQVSKNCPTRELAAKMQANDLRRRGPAAT
jgi:hypothetical protein